MLPTVIWNKKPSNWWGRQNAAPLKFDPKLSKAVFLAVFSNFDKCRPEVADEVISIFCVAAEKVDVMSP